MSIGLEQALAAQAVASTKQNAVEEICATGFVNRRSGVRFPRPAPRQTAYSLCFCGFEPVGSDGIDGTNHRFIQPRKPEQLFTGRSR